MMREGVVWQLCNEHDRLTVIAGNQFGAQLMMKLNDK